MADPVIATIGEGDDEDAWDKDKWLAEQDPAKADCYKQMFRIQDEVNDRMKRFVVERRALERRFLQDCEPRYAERRKLISGSAAVAGAGIPYFWRDVLTSFQIFADHMNENDLVVLEKLQDITCTLLDPSSDESEEEKTWGYVLTFVFEPNEHFEETELTKTYIFHDAEESDLKKTEGFKINWKPGKDPTKKVVKKKGRRGAVQRKTVPVESFFNFFSPPQIPSDYKSMDDTLAQSLDDDFRRGTLLREDVLINAFQYYTGELEDEDAEDDEDDEEDESGEGDDDDEEDDDDDSGGDDAPPAPKLPSGAGAKVGQSAQQQEECKQQ